MHSKAQLKTKQPTIWARKNLAKNYYGLSQMARVAHAAGYRSNSGNGIIAGFPRPFLLLLFFWPLGKEK
jgi:hypothetical protein